ncbi:4780_t:CDS:2 [Acaulospora colombiana]|uniref:4780_t:CDS:1 n=1 Tax=Acaulospora colombiana TaxID=27376 RepID=A0ACA9K4D2_9GLOM|nr:4780_t:CDS:2 [Acaulospora colombiana]
MLRDANTLEIAYRESFVNPIIPKAFEDVNDKIRFQTYSRVMDYYINLQEISRKAQEYNPSNENLLEASPPKKHQQKQDPDNY